MDKTLPLEEQAKQAFQLRNLIRAQTRDLMSDEATRASLDNVRPNIGFEDLVAHKVAKYGFTREEALWDIIRTASESNKDINNLFGL